MCEVCDDTRIWRAPAWSENAQPDRRETELSPAPGVEMQKTPDSMNPQVSAVPALDSRGLQSLDISETKFDQAVGEVIDKVRELDDSLWQVAGEFLRSEGQKGCHVFPRTQTL